LTSQPDARSAATARAGVVGTAAEVGTVIGVAMGIGVGTCVDEGTGIEVGTSVDEGTDGDAGWCGWFEGLRVWMRSWAGVTVHVGGVWFGFGENAGMGFLLALRFIGVNVLDMVVLPSTSRHDWLFEK
jgi:hypothetical protein